MHQPHGTAGPNTGGNVRLSNRCSIESTGIFTEMNNQAAWRALAKWLKHSSKHSNETVDKKRLVWHAISNTLNIHLPELTFAMYPAIRSYDEQAFDYNMSEESENNNFIIKKSLRPVPSQGMVEQAKKDGSFRPQ